MDTRPHHQTITCLALKQSLSRTAAIVTAKSLFGWPLKGSIERFDDITRDCKIVDSLIVRRVSHGFHLESGDRTTFIGDEFLSGCDPTWAETLQTEMLSWD
jgi:hypothetical protein